MPFRSGFGICACPSALALDSADAAGLAPPSAGAPPQAVRTAMEPATARLNNHFFVTLISHLGGQCATLACANGRRHGKSWEKPWRYARNVVRRGE